MMVYQRYKPNDFHSGYILDRFSMGEKARWEMQSETVKELKFDDNDVAQIKIEKRTQGNSFSYYTRFFIPPDKRYLNNGKIYKFESPQIKDETDAITKAQIRFGALQSFMRQDQVIPGRTFARIYEIFLADYQDNRK